MVVIKLLISRLRLSEIQYGAVDRSSVVLQATPGLVRSRHGIAATDAGSALEPSPSQIPTDFRRDSEGMNHFKLQSLLIDPPLCFDDLREVFNRRVSFSRPFRIC